MKRNAFYVVISLVAVLAIGSVVIAFNGNNAGTVFEGDCVECNIEATSPEEVNLGAFPGGDIYADLVVSGSITSGGSMAWATTSRDETHTLTYKEMLNYTYIDIMNDEEANGNLTWTLPATSTMQQLLKDDGSARKWYFHNATTTENTLTIATGAGMDLVGIDANVDALAAGSWAELTCMQVSYRGAINEDIVCIMTELIDAD